VRSGYSPCVANQAGAVRRPVVLAADDHEQTGALGQSFRGYDAHNQGETAVDGGVRPDHHRLGRTTDNADPQATPDGAPAPA
jgi:hypothetical protein